MTFHSTERQVTAVNLEKYMYFEGKYIKFASDAWSFESTVFILDKFKLFF